MSYIKAGMFAAVGALSILAGQANAISLQTIIDNGGSYSVGDLTFTNFHYSSASVLTASNIDVQFIEGEGVMFTAGWNTLTTPAGIMDTQIGYTVTAEPGKVINSLGLTMGYPASINGGTAKVSETVWEGLPEAGEEPIAGLSTISDANGPLSDNLADYIAFDPGYTQLSVEKNIAVLADKTVGGFASVTFVENWVGTGTDTGTPPPVIPEPASLVLLPLALAGLSLRKKLAR